MKIRVSDESIGSISLGLGWNTWAWRGRPISDATWEQLLDLLVASRCQWVRLDVRQSDWEPRDSRVEGYNWETPRMRVLYRWLNACEANGIDVLWANYYTSDSSLYPSDPASAWMSRRVQQHLAETGQYPSEWPRIDEAADHEHFVESFADVLDYLIRQRGYTCIKQVSLFNEATSDHTFADHNPWPFYRRLDIALRDRGIRERIKILGPDDHNVPPWFWQEFLDFPVDVVAFHDYWNLFDANKVADAKTVEDSLHHPACWTRDGRLCAGSRRGQGVGPQTGAPGTARDHRIWSHWKHLAVAAHQ